MFTVLCVFGGFVAIAKVCGFLGEKIPGSNPPKSMGPVVNAVGVQVVKELLK